MSVSKRFICLIGAGLLPLIPLSLLGGGVLFFILYNMVCFFLLFLDHFISPKGEVFSIHRQKEDKLYFKASNTLTLHVWNHYHKPLLLSLKDHVPDLHFQVLSQDMTHRVGPNGGGVFSYTLRPTKRGSFRFPGVYLKYRGILGLCDKFTYLPLPADYKVYPDLQDLSKYRLLTLKSMALENGKRVVRRKGQGQDFESLREYTEGDDLRKMNWMATARENKLIMNQYEMEKNQPVMVALDTGRPMGYTIRGYKKLDYAINAALVLSDIVNQNGDQSGLVTFNTTVDAYMKPGKGPVHRNQLMEALYHAQDTRFAADYGEVFRTLVIRQKRRCLVFIFTDFESQVEADDLYDQLQILRKRHLPVVVLMKNQSAIQLAEQEGRTEKILYQRAAALAYLRERKHLIKQLNKKGVVCIETDADTFALDTINYYLKMKASHGPL